MYYVIRLGDKTSHGGEVVSAADNYFIMGKAVARVGDYCTCPIKGHGKCQIVSGDPYWTIDGRAVAIQGISKTSCGAELISSCAEVGRSFEGDGAAGGGGNVPTSISQAVLDDGYDQHFHLADEVTGKPLVRRFYRMTCNGQMVEGYTDGDGRTAKVEADNPANVKIEIYPEGYAGAAA